MLAASLVLSLAPLALQDGAHFPPARPEEVGLDPAAVEALAQTVEGWVEDDEVIGAVLLLIKDRRTVLHEAFGLRDRERSLPMRPDTICNIRSMTKPFTGVAALQLIEQGKLQLGHRVAQYLPAFGRAPMDRITIEHLLTHRSGLPVVMAGNTPGEHSSLEAFAGTAAKQELLFAPGSAFAYSDAGTDVLGAVIAVASGGSLDRQVLAGQIVPLGLRDTFYGVAPNAAQLQRMASAYAGRRGRWSCFWSPSDEPAYDFAWGSQSLYSSATDYARFLACLMDGGEFSSGRLLEEPTVERMLAPASRMLLMPGLPVPTGFAGMQVHYAQMMTVMGTGEDVRVFGHGGSDGTMAWAFPEHDLIAVCLTQSRGSARVQYLEPLLQGLIEPVVGDAPAVAGAAGLVGCYLANFGPFRDAEFRVLIQNQSLAVDLGGRGVFELCEADPKGWRVAKVSPLLALRFDAAQQGVAGAFFFRMNGRVARVPRGELPALVPLEAGAVTALLGVYRDSDKGQDLRIFMHEGRLATELSIRPGPFELVPTEDPMCWRMALNERISFTFTRNADGQIAGYQVRGVGPKGTFRARIKAD